jgi:hypothetical protein
MFRQNRLVRFITVRLFYLAATTSELKHRIYKSTTDQ